MKKETAVAAIIVVAVLTFVGGYMFGNHSGDVTPGSQSAGAGAGGRFDSTIVPIGDSPVQGDASAPITVVLFADLAEESTDARRRWSRKFGEGHQRERPFVVKVRPSRRRNRHAAAAVFYAAEQSRWCVRFPAPMAPSTTPACATSFRRLGLSGWLQRGPQRGLQAAMIEADINLARSLGITCPAVSSMVALTGQEVNNARSAMPSPRRSTSLTASLTGDQRRSHLPRRVRSNATPGLLVARRDDRGAEGEEDEERPRRERRQPTEEQDEPTGANQPPAEQPEQDDVARADEPREPAEPPPADVERLRVPLEGAYARGPEDALVTIVAFSDFQCPFCSRVNPTIETLVEEYGADLRIAFRHNPLPMHPEAPLAAQAALAAGEQGKFWEMHDLLFANQRALSRTDLEGYAEQLGLNMDQFRTFLDENRGAAQIEADQEMATRVGARGTPHFFINGRRLRGAQPVERFREVIDSEIALSRQLMEQGTARSALYAHLMEGAQERAQAQNQEGGDDAPAVVTPPPIGSSAVRGPEDAPVTIYVFSEFQCPFCGRVQNTLEQIEQEYGERVRWVFKSFPLPFHDNAALASQAALAAGEQGKFWEYHDILFDNQRALSRADLEGYAEQLGLTWSASAMPLIRGALLPRSNRDRGRPRCWREWYADFIMTMSASSAPAADRFQPIIERHLTD
jgi:protein-disulfide isomerase